MRRAGFERAKLNYWKLFCYCAVAAAGRNRGSRCTLIHLQGIRREGPRTFGVAIANGELRGYGFTACGVPNRSEGAAPFWMTRQTFARSGIELTYFDISI